MGRIASVLLGLLALIFANAVCAESQTLICTKDEINAWLAANLKNIATPIYPPIARREGRQGSILLKLSVDESGALQNVSIMKSSGYADLDFAASNAYKDSKLTSPTCGGKPTAITAEIPIRFQLADGDMPTPRTGNPISLEERKNIEELLEITGALRLGKTVSEMFVKQMSTSLKQQHPELPANMLDALADEINKTINESMFSRGGLSETIVAIYQKYYSKEDIEALLAFYRTPVGKKSIAIMPAMAQESMTMGMLWGKGLAPVINQRVKARFKQNGYEI